MIPVHQLYTFGGPMIGNQAAVNAFDRELAGKIFRYVNVPDPVPKLPTVSLVANQYTHCQKEMTLGVAGAAGAAADFFAQLGKQTVDGILNATLLERPEGADRRTRHGQLSQARRGTVEEINTARLALKSAAGFGR
jgi:hypothetical protein